MAIYAYKKEVNSTKKKILKNLSTITLLLGIVLLFWAFYPVISFEIYSKIFLNRGYSSPISLSNTENKVENIENSILGINSRNSQNEDLTKASLWFPSINADLKSPKKIFVKEYKLTIPKLNINNAKVIVGGEDLSKSLIHYLPTTLPGEKGNVVIFGHSTLPQLYNTKDYKTIFTYLSSLNNNDVINVELGDEIFVYKINEMFIVKPDQVSVLDKISDDSYLTLITCVPPGTYWNRLVIRAKLSNSLTDY